MPSASTTTVSSSPLVGIIMGSASDMEHMEPAREILRQFGVPHEFKVVSAHRTPEEVEKFAKGAAQRGIKVIIAAAGMAAHLPGVIASMTPLPVIGVPISTSLEGLDSILSIVQMPPGVPVATVGLNAAQNAGILAAQIIGSCDHKTMEEVVRFKENLKKKIVDANKELKKIKFPYKTN